MFPRSPPPPKLKHSWTNNCITNQTINSSPKREKLDKNHPHSVIVRPRNHGGYSRWTVMLWPPLRWSASCSFPPLVRLPFPRSRSPVLSANLALTPPPILKIGAGDREIIKNSYLGRNSVPFDLLHVIHVVCLSRNLLHWAITPRRATSPSKR